MIGIQEVPIASSTEIAKEAMPVLLDAIKVVCYVHDVDSRASGITQAGSRRRAARVGGLLDSV